MRGMPPPTPKDDWIAQFVSELLLRQRPELGSKFARLIAHGEWVAHRGEKPAEVAKRWIAERKKSD